MKTIKMNQFSQLKLINMSDIQSLPPNGRLDTLIEAYRNGYRITETMEPPATKTLATCNATSKTVGQVITFSATPKGGTAPYAISFAKAPLSTYPAGQTSVKSYTGIAEGTTVTTTYTTAAADVPGIVCLVGVTDSCPSGALNIGDYCNITIYPVCDTPTPNFTIS